MPIVLSMGMTSAFLLPGGRGGWDLAQWQNTWLVPQFSFWLKTSKQANKKELEIPKLPTKGEEDDLSSFSVAGKVEKKNNSEKSSVLLFLLVPGCLAQLRPTLAAVYPSLIVLSVYHSRVLRWGREKVTLELELASTSDRLLSAWAIMNKSISSLFWTSVSHI